MSNDNSTAATGFGIGFFLSGFISFVLNGFLWSILHAFFGWFYIIYVVLFRAKDIVPAFKNMFL